MPPLLASRGGVEQLEDVRTLMSIAEGYAEFLVDRCVGNLIPQAAAPREAGDRRRGGPAPRALLRVIAAFAMSRRRGLPATRPPPDGEPLPVTGYRLPAGPSPLAPR